MKILKARKEDWIQLSCWSVKYSLKLFVVIILVMDFFPQKYSFLSKSTQCSTRAIDSESLCDDKSKDYMKEAIRGFSGEVFDLFCGNDLHWESHNCQKV